MGNNCNICKGRIVMCAFSEGKCEICGDKVVSPNTPCDRICKSCANVHNLCSVCGREIKESELL